MPDTVPANGVILPNRPWIARSDLAAGPQVNAHAVRLGCVAIAVVSLFIVGFDLGAGNPIDPVALVVGVAGSLAAVLIPLSDHDRASRQRPAQSSALPYSEQVLLQVWPARETTRSARTE
jgi:hypothetical protein